MNSDTSAWVRRATLCAISICFLNLWGFAAADKFANGIPSWFADKFGKTFFASFPGLSATFWILSVSELLGFALGVVALLRGEFWESRPLLFLPWTLAWSLFVFLQLGFGQWLTHEFNGAFQQFMYFCGTLVALNFVMQIREKP